MDVALYNPAYKKIAYKIYATGFLSYISVFETGQSTFNRCAKQRSFHHHSSTDVQRTVHFITTVRQILQLLVPDTHRQYSIFRTCFKCF